MKQQSQFNSFSLYADCLFYVWAEPARPLQQTPCSQGEIFHSFLKCAQDELGRQPGSRLQSTPDCLMGFIFGRKKQSEHNKNQSPGGFADCCSLKETHGATMQKKKKRKTTKQSMGLFFAPLNLEITLATEPCHCERRVGKCGRNWNGEWPGNEHRPFSILSFSKKDKIILTPLKIVALKMWEEQQ